MKAMTELGLQAWRLYDSMEGGIDRFIERRYNSWREAHRSDGELKFADYLAAHEVKMALALSCVLSIEFAKDGYNLMHMPEIYQSVSEAVKDLPGIVQFVVKELPGPVALGSLGAYGGYYFGGALGGTYALIKAGLISAAHQAENESREKSDQAEP